MLGGPGEAFLEEISDWLGVPERPLPDQHPAQLPAARLECSAVKGGAGESLGCLLDGA